VPFGRLGGLTPQFVCWNPISGALGAESRSRCRSSRYCALGGGSRWSASAAESLSMIPLEVVADCFQATGAARRPPDSSVLMWICIRI
jgi:hypothetical protein